MGDEEDEASLSAVKYPVMPSLVALQQMRNRLHLAQLGKKLMKWTALATGKELRRLSIEMTTVMKDYRMKLRTAFMLLARARYFFPSMNTTVLESIPKQACVTVTSTSRSVSGVKVKNLQLVEMGCDSYQYLGMSKGGMVIKECKEAWLDLLRTMVLVCQFRNTFMQIDLAHKNATKKQNVLTRCVIPRIIITMRYILSELDEQEREESFRLKRFKQLKYKNVKPKSIETETSEEEHICCLLKEEEPEPTKPKPKPIIQPELEKIIPPVDPCSCATKVPPPPKVEPIMSPTPEGDSCSFATEVPSPPKVESIIPPPPEVDPCSCTTEVPPPPKVASIIPPPPEVDSCSFATEVPSPPKVESIIPPPPEVDPCSCSTIMPPPKEEKASPTETQKRLDHLMEHLNEILQIAKKLQASKQTPRIESFIKCCDEVKGKIKDLSFAPSPRGGPKVCSATAGVVSREPSVSSKQPSICSKPSEKPSAVSTQSVARSARSQVQSDVFELEPVNKTTLGEFEKRFEEKIKVTRTRKPDGSISEEKQIITIQTEKRTPRPEKGGGGAKSPCVSGDQYSRGKRGDGSGRGKKRGGTRSPSCTSKTSGSQTPSRTSKFSASRTPSCTSKTSGSRSPTSTCTCNVSRVTNGFFTSVMSPVPSETCWTQVASKPIETFEPCGTPKQSEISKRCKICGASTPSKTAMLCGTPKPSDTSKPCGTPKSSDTSKPCGASKPSEISKPRATPKPSETSKPCKICGASTRSETAKPRGTPKFSETSKPCKICGASMPSEIAKPCGAAKPSETSKPCKICGASTLSETAKPRGTPKPSETFKPCKICGASTPSETAKLRGAPKPSETSKPCNICVASTPSETAMPHGTPKPSETSKPCKICGASTPSEIAKPCAAPKPNETSKPCNICVASTPSETAKPRGTPKPSETSKPCKICGASTPSKIAKPCAALKPSETSKPCGTPKPSDTSKPCGTPKPSETAKPCGASPCGDPKPSETSKPCGDSKPSETSKPCGTPKPSDTSMPCGAAKTTESFKPCGCPMPCMTTKPSGAPQPSVTLKPCGCPKTVPSEASATRQSSDTFTCGSSYFSTTMSYMSPTSYPLPTNEQSSCIGSPKRLMMNTCSSKSTASSLLGSTTCSCIVVSVSENQSKELPDPMKTKLTFKSESTSAHSFVQNLPEILLKKPEEKPAEKYSGDKSTYCIPNCGAIRIGKNTSTQSKCSFAFASPSPSTTSNSLKRAEAGQSDCSRTSTNTIEANMDSVIVVRGSRLNALRKMILHSDNSMDCHIRGIASVSNLSSYKCLCASSQTSASSIKIWQAPFQQNPECLTCLATKESEIEADVSYTQDMHSCGSQSVSYKITPDPASCAVLAECKAAVAALAEHIRNAGSFSPSSSNIWYPTFGTPKRFTDATTSPTLQDRSDSNSFEALYNDEDRERVRQRPYSSSIDTHLVNEKVECDLVHKVSSSSI